MQLGNSNDVPTYQRDLVGNDPFANAAQNNPRGFDICVECCDGAQFPSSIELACAEGHIRRLDELWTSRWQREINGKEAPTRPPPSANHVLHLAFPSSPPSNQYTVNNLLSFVAFLQTLLYPTPRSSSPSIAASPASYGSPGSLSTSSSYSSGVLSTRRDNSAGSTPVNGAPPISRKCKVLLFSSDGYTETSILALCLLMSPKPSHYVNPQHSALAVFGSSATNSPRLGPTSPQQPLQRTQSTSAVNKAYTPNGSTTTGMSLPDAYLELQISQGRSFYVYPTDMDLLKRAEARLYTAPREIPKERGRERETVARTVTVDGSNSVDAASQANGGSSRWKWSTWGSRASFSIPSPPPEEEEAPQSASGAATMLTPMLSSSTPSASLISGSSLRASSTPRRRARASTSPVPHVWSDHWAWFSDPRFDGSFPSRVLPFLYLGNL
jgi:dual specificity MAP kinase phosphatase